MAKLRNISADTLTVPALGGRVVEPDELVDVPDALLKDLDWPESTWAPVVTKKTTKDEE